MKKLLLIFVILNSFLCFSQNDTADIVQLKNYDVIKGKIIEDHHPDYLIIKSEILGEFRINYKQIKKINTLRASLSKEEIIKKKKKENKEKKNYNYLSIGSGLGYSYGGIGARFQYRIGSELGFAYQIGLGYNEFSQKPNSSHPKYQTNGPALSLGLKFLYLDWFYVNINYLFNIGSDGSTSIHDIFIPSFLIGTDYFFTKHWGINAAVGICTYDHIFLIDFNKVNSVSKSMAPIFNLIVVNPFNNFSLI